jgi:hypothetical protein
MNGGRHDCHRSASQLTVAEIGSLAGQTFMQQFMPFVRGHLLQVLLIVPGALVLTLLHESAHALAVMLQGGSITELQWLPSAKDWGHVSFTFPAGTQHSSMFISLAPYILSLLFVTIALLLSWFRPIRSDRVASYAFFWLYFIPVADIGFALLIWTLGGDNDAAKAFGSRSYLSAVSALGYASVVCVLGYVVQARLYDRLRLGLVPYAALVLTAFVLMVTVLTVGYRFSGRTV